MGHDAISLWDATSQEADIVNPMTGDGNVDVAIIGGGFTGLSTALHCAQKGLSAHVLEARQVGFGGSGRNCGLVNAALWLPPQEVRARLGPTYGPRFLKKFGAGPAYVFELIERHQIRCEATRTGTIHAAHGPAGFVELAARHREWQRLGEPVDLLDRDEVARLVGTDHFHGGLVDQRCGTINPMGYCRGLARVAMASGAEISTGVRATGLRRVGDGWRVVTGQGVLTAKAVILATNAYTDDLWPNLRRNFTVIDYFQLATRPLGPEAAHILPGRQGLWDTGKIMFNVRRDGFGRLLVGSMGRVIGSRDRGLSRRWARTRIARIFPDIGPVEFEEAWDGQIAMTPDHLPRIHELDRNLFTPIGYNGRGITTGTLFGQTMAELLTGADRDDLPLPMTATRTVRSASLASRLYRSLLASKQMFGAL